MQNDCPTIMFGLERQLENCSPEPTLQSVSNTPICVYFYAKLEYYTACIKQLVYMVTIGDDRCIPTTTGELYTVTNMHCALCSICHLCVVFHA